MNEILTKFVESAHTYLLQELEALNRYLREKGLGQGEIDSISSLYDEIDTLKDADTKLKIAVEALQGLIASVKGYRKNINDNQPCDAEVFAEQALEKIGK